MHNIHQRPIKTAAIHKKWIDELNYFWYLVASGIAGGCVCTYNHYY